MADKIVVNYPMLVQMARTMGQSAKRLESCLGEMNKVVATLEQGGLRGDAGAAFSQAVRGSLNPSLKRLQDKFEELNGDINKNIEIMKEKDRLSAQGHRS